jgi:hypothetical protein
VRKHLEELPVLVEASPIARCWGGEPDLPTCWFRPAPSARHHTTPAAPGAIYLFRRNLLRACADREELEREIRITVQHEVGHLLGLDEDDLESWGLA